MDATDFYIFGPFKLIVSRRELLADGLPVSLGSRAFDVLLALVRRRGQLATKAELMNEVWLSSAVEENNLTTQIAAVRRVLGGAGSGERWILTVAGRGYRFVGPIEPSPVEGMRPPAPLPSLHLGTAERDNLPRLATSFVGREAELEEIRARLRTRPLLSLIGSGGVGKTRVALRVGSDLLADFADGVWLLELAPLGDGELVAEALCRLLGATVSGSRPAVAVAIDFLQHKRLLLILDNCEHLLGGVAQLASAIGRHCPGVRVLATSREKLGINGEAIYRMPSLPLPPARARIDAATAMRSDAVRLFVDRASEALGGYWLRDEDAPAVATICRRLDGVALAMEMAAARLRMLKPAEIAARLEDVFRLLTGGDRAALPRQQTLRATIDWSYNLLSVPEQVLLRRLSIFMDGFSLEGAAAVASFAPIAAEDIFDLLGALADKSLVVADTSGASTRFRMLQTTRQYGAEKLAESGESGLHRRLAVYLAGFFATAERTWPTTATEAWLAENAPETENLRFAIDWAFGGAPDGQAVAPALGVTLVANAGCLTQELSLQADMQRWAEAASSHLSPLTPPAEAAAILLELTQRQGDFGAAEIPPERRRAIALFRETGDAHGLSRALRVAGIALARPDDPNEEARALIDESIRLLRPLGASKDLAATLANAGVLAFFRNEHDMARRFTEEALMMRRLIGDRPGLLASSINLGELAFLEGRVQAAIHYAEQAASQALEWNVLATRAHILCNLAGYRLSVDDLDQARACALDALALNRALGQTDYAVLCLEHLALAACLAGEYIPAARLLGYTDTHFRRTGQTRDRLEQAGYDRLTHCLNAGVERGEIDRLMEEGASWNAEAAYAAAAALAIIRDAADAPISRDQNKIVALRSVLP